MRPELFDIWDIIFGTGWAILIVLIGLFIRLKNLDKPHYKYFVPHLLFKLFFGVFFGLTYAIILEGGGDTLAYWDGAVKMNHVFWENPLAYFHEMWKYPDFKTVTENFSSSTGIPPAWIYREPESWFVSKIVSLFTFVSFNSYIALTCILSFISALASWKFFELVRKHNISSEKWIIIATLFIPTVAFWCAGISKDTIILAALFLLLYHLFSIIDKERRVKLGNVISIVLFAFILYKIRPFMLIALAPPLFLAFGTGFLKRLSDSFLFLFLARFIFIGAMIVLAVAYISGSAGMGDLNPDKYLEEVAIIQQDFAENKTYTGYRYDLGVSDYSPAGMLKAAPMSIITSFYRPFIWEANSAFLLLSGIEGLLLLFFTFRFFFNKKGITYQIGMVRKQELLVFAIVFVTIFGFFVGFTAGLFNVLVRFKAPLMPFLFLFFTSYYRSEEPIKQEL